VTLTSLKKGVTYSARKAFNHLHLNILELLENKSLFKSALRSYLLTHVLYSVEEFLAYNNDKKEIILL
jgi:hypothetical protein